MRSTAYCFRISPRPTSDLILHGCYRTDGPFNSWDRQPYIYRLNESQTDGKGELRISPQTQTIANNLIFTVNFNGQSCGSIGIDRKLLLCLVRQSQHRLRCGGN